MRRRGFSFVEMLFAVMILGIGFIMIAGVFPVAISQQQTNADETTGANIARSAAAYLDTVAGTDGYMNDDAAILHPFTGDLWKAVAGNAIMPDDPRYAWVPLWRRGKDPYGNKLPVAQVVIIPVRVRIRDSYFPKTDLADNGTLTPKQVTVTLRVDATANNAQEIRLSGAGATAASPGTFVVIANGNDLNGDSAVGRVYRLGPHPDNSTNANLYLLSPGNDMTRPNKQRLTGATAYLVGQDKDPTNNFSGGPQDINVYSTYIRVNP
jgi:prepilin-type N-terminal cleavage/methylation domain-containing protein